MIHFIPHYRQSPNAKWLAANSRVTRKCLRSGDTTGDATEAAGMAWHLFDHKRRHDRAKKKHAPRSPLTGRRIWIDMRRRARDRVRSRLGTRARKRISKSLLAHPVRSERGADEPVITLAPRLRLSARKHLHYDIRIDRFTGSERRKQQRRGGRQEAERGMGRDEQ